MTENVITGVNEQPVIVTWNINKSAKYEGRDIAIAIRDKDDKTPGSQKEREKKVERYDYEILNRLQT